MPISPQLAKDVKFFGYLDPTKDSVSLAYNQRDLKCEKRRSSFHNFLRWFIHIITFTLVPRNEDLDKIARRILNNTNEFQLNKGITNREKILLNLGIKNLLTIIRENGGRYEAKVNKLLQSISKINHIVQEIGDQPAIENPAEQEDFPDYAKKMREQKTLLEQRLDSKEPVFEIIEEVKDIEGFFNILNEETQIKLLLSIRKENLNPEKLKLLLKAAIKLPLKFWENTDFFTVNIVTKSFLITFFQVLNEFDDTTHMWKIFDKICNEIYPIYTIEINLSYFNADYIWMLSEKQKERLHLEKYEPSLQVISSIKHRKLDLPECQEKIIEQIKNFTDTQKGDFFTLLTSINAEDPSGAEDKKINHWLYFISWLEELLPQQLHPHTQMLEDTIRNICSKDNEPILKQFTNLTTKKLIKAVSYNTLKNYVAPFIIGKILEQQMQQMHISESLTKNLEKIINKIFKLLKFKDAQIIIDNNWNFITNIPRPKFNHNFLRYIDEAQKLKVLLPKVIISRKNFVKSSVWKYFDHFEKYPWKLHLLLDDEKFQSLELIKEIKYKFYPICSEILNKHRKKKLMFLGVEGLEKSKQYNEQFQAFFTFAKNNDYVNALQKYHSFENDIKKHFVALTSHSSTKILYQELPSLNEAQLLVSLLHEESNTNMCKNLAEGVKKDLVPLETLSPILHLAINIKKAFGQDEKIALVEKFLSYPIENYENENFKISKCYNNPTHSDMDFAFGGETVHVHQAFLSLNPDLRKYIPENPELNKIVVVNDQEEATKIKLALKRFYNFQMRDLILPRSEIKSLYNNPKSYPDFVIACGKDEIHVHRVLLATYLPFFEIMLSNKMRETLSHRMELSDEKFKLLKMIVECIVYAHGMPVFPVDDITEDIYLAELNFYRPED